MLYTYRRFWGLFDGENWKDDFDFQLFYKRLLSLRKALRQGGFSSTLFK